jgi:hypothetical protein
MTQLKSDTTIEGETYYVEDFSSPSRPYEGHYQHNKVEVRKVVLSSRFFEGDYLVPVNQENKRYIVETLEPQGMDSFFTWNFFDSILQQKEWFSDYVFEDEAAEMLNEQPDLRKKMDEMKTKDPAFAQSQWAQLYFLYQQSKNFELTLNRYPIFRLYE